MTTAAIVSTFSFSGVRSSNPCGDAQIVINSQATDANGIARDIDPAIRRNLMASLANSGQR